MGKPTKKVASATPAARFDITIKLGTTTFKGTGATALAALSSIKKPDKIVGKMFLTITNGDKKKEMLFWPQRAKRLFYNASFQAIQAKQLMLLMK